MPTTPEVYDGPLPEQDIFNADGMHNSPREEVALSGGGSTIPPNWGSWDFGGGEIGLAYRHEWDMVNPDRPIAFSVLSGTLPAGLSLTSTGDGHSARIDGTPTTAGSYSFTLRATSAVGTADKSFSITITAASGNSAYTFVC